MKDVPLHKLMEVFSNKFHQPDLDNQSEDQLVNKEHGGLFKWSQSLITTSQELLSFFTEKEEEFLALGSIIQEGYRETKKLSSSSEALIKQINQEGQNDSIGELNQKFVEISDYWQVFNPDRLWGRLHKLKEVTSTLKSLLGNFERIVLRLKVLSVSTRVETARLGNEGEGFGILAQDVSSLTSEGEDETQKIQEKTQAVQEDMQLACQKTKSLSQEQNFDAQNPISEVKSGLAKLSELQSHSSQFVEKLSTHSERISEQIGEIVSKIQFHDITRQQIQHVHEVMDEVKQVVDNHNHNQNISEQDLEILSWIFDICQLQISHLNASKDGFSQALDHIRKNIGGIIEQIQNIVADIQDIGWEQDGHSVLEKIQEDMNKVVKNLRQTAGKSDDIVEIMKVVGGVVQEMGEFIENVEEIGVRIERIGLNASIQAAHIGENGRAMGVLAEAIHRLSLESKKQTQDITDLLNEVVAESEQFQEQTREAKELASREGELIAGFERLIKVLQQIHSNIQSHLEYVRNSSKDLIEKLRRVTEDKELEAEVLKRFESAQEEIGVIKDEIRSLLPEEGFKRSERLNSLLERYTMESERQIHLKFFDEEGGSQEDVSLFDEGDDNIELFDDQDESEEYQQDKEDSEFGDNVELF